MIISTQASLQNSTQTIVDFSPFAGKRIGIISGDFAVVHKGHLLAGELAMCEKKLDAVIYVPLFDPLRVDTLISTREQQEMMLAAALGEYKDFYVLKTSSSDPKQQVIDIVRTAREEAQGSEIMVVTGSNNARFLNEWKEVDELISLSTIVFLTRPNTPVGKSLRHLFSPAQREKFNADAIPIMGSPIRYDDVVNALKAGDERRMQEFIPAPVLEYLARHGNPYRNPEPIELGESPENLRDVSISVKQDFPISHLGVLQFAPNSGNIVDNVNRLRDDIRKLRATGAKIIVAPETATTGYLNGDYFNVNDFVLSDHEAIKALAREARGCAVFTGFVHGQTEGVNPDGSMRKFNSVAVLHEGAVRFIHHKAHLPNYSQFDDLRYFAEGGATTPVALKLDGRVVRIGVLDCEDIWRNSDNWGTPSSIYASQAERNLVRELNDQGAEMFISVNQSPFAAGKLAVVDQLIRGHVAATGKPFAWINAAGIGDISKNIIVFAGGSLVYDQNGRLRHFGKRFASDASVLTLNQLSQITLPQFSETQEVLEAAKHGWAGYAQATGKKKCVIPFSGGADSALALFIAVQAVGPENVLALNMPSRFNKQSTKEIARITAQNFGVEYGVIPIEESLQVTREMYERHRAQIMRSLSGENMQARQRGEFASIASGEEDRLLVSCGNRTEVLLGYCTYAGDMRGFLSPVGDFWKTQVYDALRYVNEVIYGREMISSTLYDGSEMPSAELAEGQYDPFDYHVADPILKAFNIHRLSVDQVVAGFKRGAYEDWPRDFHGKSVYDKLDLEKFKALTEELYVKWVLTQFKRHQGAPNLVVNGSSPGFVFRQPIISGWRGRRLTFD